MKLIDTTGIPHNLTKAECIKDYNNLKNDKKIPLSSNGCIITCLTGDILMHKYIKIKI